MRESYLLNQEGVQQQQAFFHKVYGWMALALATTGIVAWQTASSDIIQGILAQNPGIFIGLLILQVIVVLGLSWGIKKMNSFTALVLFFLYSALTGLTFSILFLVYTQASIASTFFITAGTFGVMSFYGMTTKTDLTTMGNILFMALIGLIIASVVNIFMRSSMIYWLTTFAGVIIFTGLTAYDTQKIKHSSELYPQGSEQYIKTAILGALMLYLDFINLFIYLLRLMGKRR